MIGNGRLCSSPGVDDDELGELPPLDDEATEAPSGDEATESDVSLPSGEEGLDDSTGEDDPADDAEIDLDESETGWLDEPTDNPSVDFGVVSTFDLTEGIEADDDPEDAPWVSEDFGIATLSETTELDGGDEGPVDPDEELREDNLPALDSDEAGEMDEASLIDASFAAATDEPIGLPWAATPWERVIAPSAELSAVGVACAGRGAVVLGRHASGAAGLWAIDLEGSRDLLSPEGIDLTSVRTLHAQGRAIIACAGAGECFASTDGGLTFVKEPMARKATELRGEAPPQARLPRVAAKRGERQAYAAQAGGVVRRLAGGTWKTYVWGGRVTAIVFLDDAGSLLAATYADGEDTTALVHLDSGERPVVVARIGATRDNPESDGRVAAMAFDEARGVVWLAGGFGVAAFAVR